VYETGFKLISWVRMSWAIGEHNLNELSLEIEFAKYRLVLEATGQSRDYNSFQLAAATGGALPYLITATMLYQSEDSGRNTGKVYWTDGTVQTFDETGPF